MKLYYFTHEVDDSPSGSAYRVYTTKKAAIQGRKAEMKKKADYASERARELSERYGDDEEELCERLISGELSSFSEIFLVEYDPTKAGVANLLERMLN